MVERKASGLKLGVFPILLIGFCKVAPTYLEMAPPPIMFGRVNSRLLNNAHTVYLRNRWNMSLRLYSLLKNSTLSLLLGGAAVRRFCACFWVAQRFTAAIKRFF